MTPDLLAQVGSALFGDRWKTDVAKTLGVTDRTVERWSAGAVKPPSNAELQLRYAVAARLTVLQQAAQALERARKAPKVVAPPKKRRKPTPGA